MGQVIRQPDLIGLRFRALAPAAPATAGKAIKKR
jgi:hypothetical protein